jgi:TfoX/Sxy family transcriptional regulator of competence genes
MGRTVDTASNLRNVAYDQDFADRVRDALSMREGLTERKMFGGIGFMVGGNMACGVTSTSELMVRIAPEENEAALAEEHVREFEMSGKKMSGWLIVAREGVATDEDLAGWVDAGADHAASMPAK